MNPQPFFQYDYSLQPDLPRAHPSISAHPSTSDDPSIMSAKKWKRIGFNDNNCHFCTGARNWNSLRLPHFKACHPLFADALIQSNITLERVAEISKEIKSNRRLKSTEDKKRMFLSGLNLEFREVPLFLCFGLNGL